MSQNRWMEIGVTLSFECRRALGVSGLLGLLLLAGAAALYAARPALQASTQQLRQRTQQARIEQARLPAHHPQPVVSPSQFPGMFPVLGQNSADLAAIFAQARAAQLTLDTAQYQVAVVPGGRFTRYQVLLPVKSPYAAIRRFIAGVLNTLPHAALQEIHAERPAVDGEVLDARIRFELIYRTAAS